MENNSSNEGMEQVFKQLAGIQKVEPSADLYATILNRVEKPQVISLTWLRAAAAILLIIFSLELLLVKRNRDSADNNRLEILVPQTQNILYND